MKKSYAKSLREYSSQFKLEEKRILESLNKLKSTKKLPTSIALEKETISELKRLAMEKGVPYQVLMRMFILDGLRRMKRSAA